MQMISDPHAGPGEVVGFVTLGGHEFVIVEWPSGVKERCIPDELKVIER